MAPVALGERKDIELTAPSGPVWIQGNGEMLFRAVRNLVENAISYTSAGTSVEVEVTDFWCRYGDGQGTRHPRGRT